FVYYWIPPSVYLYIRTVANDEQRLRRKDYLHFLLPVLALCLLFYYLGAGYLYAGKIKLPSKDFLTSLPSVGYIPSVYHAGLIFIMAVGYAINCWKVVLRKFTRERLQHPQSRKIRNWILTILIPTTLLTFIVSVSGVFWIFGGMQVTAELFYYQI